MSRMLAHGSDWPMTSDRGWKDCRRVPSRSSIMTDGRQFFSLNTLVIIGNAISSDGKHRLQFGFSVASQLHRLAIANEPDFVFANLDADRVGPGERSQQEKEETSLHVRLWSTPECRPLTTMACITLHSYARPRRRSILRRSRFDGLPSTALCSSASFSLDSRLASVSR